MKKIKISGVSLPLYLGLLSILVIVIAMGKLPLNMLGITFMLILLGHLFYWIGQNLPIFKDYLGGGSVFTLLAAALLNTFGIIPKDVVTATGNFMQGWGFLDFYIAALICGSILGMNRNLLVKASARFIPISLITMVVGFFAVGGMGVFLGQGFGHSVLYISMAQMAGGVGAGIVPLSKIYANALHIAPGTVLNQLAPATTLGNLFAIIGAIFIDKAFANTKMNGHGVLIEVDKSELKNNDITLDATEIGVGLMLAFGLFLIGTILNAFIPKIHSYAFMIIIVFILKATNAVPKRLENAVVSFNQVIMNNLTHAVLAGIGLAMMDLTKLASAMSWQFLVLSLTSVVVMGIGAGLLGKLFGLFPVETAIGAGMINNSMGGTGNIAVLSAADRMEMMAFAQMANRLCGAIVLILGGILIRFFN
ncbi:2-hydroxycarboxylate transporter family protein [Streptococcus parauberis]|uniref:Malate Na(+) symporter n=1 Tax=Streptococcus parauberis KRS-02083 TaxID=1207545 RepID=A0ABN0IQ25_9STRE|nr:2-hydroxycarboxylate transporter family protein [Streptococcus parauberis]AEF25978.1 Putative malate transporter [Streptococcus parauberis KCTC 11537]AUT05234.1 Citrate-sodium symporter [Streptococcus parauberis]EMG24892.1 Malate Na(+) symporter [Streptococcus parauberis KRS-02083]MDT2750069.1 2-hydroxycarboxylate transporter family protein [Streptococcus parauberis]ONH63649.1 Citrate-sodium symporter [Streptococcus parauberis]